MKDKLKSFLDGKDVQDVILEDASDEEIDAIVQTIENLEQEWRWYEEQYTFDMLAAGKDWDVARIAMKEMLEASADYIIELDSWDDVDDAKGTIKSKYGEDLGEMVEGKGYNTYNQSYLGPNVLIHPYYPSDVSKGVIVLVSRHLGGDIRGNYSREAYIFEVADEVEVEEKIWGMLAGVISIQIQFKDGSSCTFYSDQDSDIPYYGEIEDITTSTADIDQMKLEFPDYEAGPTGMAQQFANKMMSYKQGVDRDKFVDDVIEAYIDRG